MYIFYIYTHTLGFFNESGDGLLPLWMFFCNLFFLFLLVPKKKKDFFSLSPPRH